MTIGFAATHLDSNGAFFLLAADSRCSTAQASADMVIKTYSLGGRTGAVAAGSALSVATAAELTRGVVDDHNRLTPTAPVNFYSTVRLFSSFLSRIERANPWSTGCEVALAGFLSNGSPALAKVSTSPHEKAIAHMYAHKQPGSLVVLVGQPGAKHQICAALEQAFGEPGPHWIQRAVATIQYLCQHEAERTIGGAPSVATCTRDGPVQWPFVVVDGKTYLRGFDVSASIPSSVTPRPDDGVLYLAYEQAWHSAADRAAREVTPKLDEGFVGMSRYVDDWVLASELFAWKVDPEAFGPTPDLTLTPAVVVIAVPGELPGT